MAGATAALADLRAANSKEAEFREYLVRSGAAESLIKVLVGLEEAEAKPELPVEFLREMFESAELQDVASKRFDHRYSADALQRKNEELRQDIEAAEVELGPKLERIKRITEGTEGGG